MSVPWAELPSVVPAGFLGTWIVLVGLAAGSFLNVVVHRLPRGDFPGSKRSRCPSCDRGIPWYQNLPIVSWLALRGRCSGCGASISPRYVILEALAGGLALACWLIFGWSLALPFALVFGWAMLALVFIDLEHMILPDAITLPGTFLALALSWWNPLVGSPADALLGVLLAIFAVEGLNLAYKILRGRDGFGAGDTKMLMLVGAVLGWKLGLFTLVAGSVIGALCVIPILAWRGRATSPEPEDGGAAEMDADSPEEDPAERPSLAEILLPSSPEGLLAPLTYLALVLSFLVARAAEPSRALAGLLVGLAAMWAVDRLLSRRSAGGPARFDRPSELLPLAGAIAGLPPTGRTAIAAGVIALLWAAARPLLARLLPPDRPGPELDDAAPAEPASALQLELPFGVFLGIGALLSMLAGEGVIAWYVGLLPSPLPEY